MKYVLYHASCADGFGAAFAAWLKFGDDAKYIAVQYGKPVPEIPDGSEVYILDFSYPTMPLIELWGRSKLLVVLDHHATARTELQSMVVKEPSLIRFDMEKSGAVLAWEYFHAEHQEYINAVPEFFLYLQDRDLWQWKLPMSREISDAIRSYPFDFETWGLISGLRRPKNSKANGILPEFLDEPVAISNLKTEGVGIRRMTKQIVEQAARNARWAHFDLGDKSVLAYTPFFHEMTPDEIVERMETLTIAAGGAEYFVPCLNCTAFISETCEKMLELFPKSPFVTAYFDSKDGKRIYSLRSRKNFDCSPIAKIMGGGGHAQACGFTQTL